MIVWAFIVQVLDSLSFLLAYNRYGIEGEALPFPSMFYEAGGVWGIVAMKALGIVAVTLGLVWLSKRPEPNAQRLGVICSWVVLWFGMTGALLNVWSWSL